MIELFIYLLGWVVFSVGYYIWNVYITKQTAHKTKKLIIYEGTKYGFFSWFAVLFFIFLGVFTLILGGLLNLDEYISEKLNK